MMVDKLDLKALVNSGLQLSGKSVEEHPRLLLHRHAILADEVARNEEELAVVLA
jgi:hypothetical protein